MNSAWPLQPSCLVLAIGVAATGVGCASPVLECEPTPRWTATTTRLAADGGSAFLLGIADETVLTWESAAESSGHSIVGRSGADARSLMAVAWGARGPSLAAIVLGARDEWVALDDTTMTRGRLGQPRELVVSNSPVFLRYLATRPGEPGIFDWSPHWAAMSEHTLHTSRDVLRFDDDYVGFTLVPIAAPIVRGASSPDERFTCVTAEYEAPSGDQPGRYGVHCFEWASMPRFQPRPDWSRQGEFPESGAAFFDQPIAVVPFSESDLRYVSAGRLELAPLTSFRTGEQALDVTATRCGFWAHDGENIFYSSGGRFQQVPVPTRPVEWQVRNHVFGPQSAASLLDGVLTFLLPHPVSP